MALKYEGPGEALGFGDVAGGAHELGELLVGHWLRIDVEGVERHLADGTFTVGRKPILGVGAHEESGRRRASPCRPSTPPRAVTRAAASARDSINTLARCLLGTQHGCGTPASANSLNSGFTRRGLPPSLTR